MIGQRLRGFISFWVTSFSQYRRPLLDYSRCSDRNWWIHDNRWLGSLVGPLRKFREFSGAHDDIFCETTPSAVDVGFWLCAAVVVCQVPTSILVTPVPWNVGIDDESDRHTVRFARLLKQCNVRSIISCRKLMATSLMITLWIVNIMCDHNKQIHSVNDLKEKQLKLYAYQ